MKRPCGRGRNAAALGFLLACLLLAWSPRGFALDPTLDVSQYAHKAWKNREGFSKGTIRSIAQTPDGYLWLGTEFGLLRFDGVQAAPWQPPPDQHFPSDEISKLLTARDGTLWIGTTKGLASWKAGKITKYAELAAYRVQALVEDREGAVWASGTATPAGKLCAVKKGAVQCYGQDGRFGFGVFSLFEDSKGNLWAGVLNGVWRWKPGPPQFYRVQGEPASIGGLAEGKDGALWIGSRTGIQQIVDGKIEAFPLPGPPRHFDALRLLRDREGGLWIGTGQGLVHVHAGRTDVFAQSDGLSGNDVTAFFEDRESNIWVATRSGLDSFRDVAAATFSLNQGLSGADIGPVLAARDGSVWLGSTQGLNRWNDGKITIYRERSAPVMAGVREITGRGLPNGSIGSLFQDARGRIWVATIRGVGYLENDRFTALSAVPGGVVRAITEDSGGNLWIASQYRGLLRVPPDGTVQQIPWSELGRKDFATALVVDSFRGGLWIGFFQSGMAYFKDGKIRASYAVADGLGEGIVNDFRFDQGGAVWAATDGGLSRLKDGRVATLTSKNGLPCDAVQGAIEDDDHSFWLYMACGVVRVARPELDAWTAAVDKEKDAKQTVRVTLFDSSDGVMSHAGAGGYSPHVAKSTDGRLWFLPWDGVSVIDPRRLHFNALPPPVHIEQIIANNQRYETTADLSGRFRLPPRIHNLEIDYTALSFVAPEKVLFRYRLEPKEREWQDAGTRRQAFYNDLDPGNYRFRVIASNNSGVWNETGASFDFSVDPAYYQTTWFRLSCVAAFLLFLGALYRARLRRVARHFEVRLEERTRIAQDLHDTLLQGCLSASMQLHLAIDRMPEDSATRKTLTHVQQLMTRVIDEGRNTLRGLRVSDPNTYDLEQAFSRVEKEIAPGGNTAFRIIVHGNRMPLDPLIRDEIYRIGREALVNAFRHARAQQIEVEIDYGPRRLRVLVRDDGGGIDPAILSSGREGHFGLSGMRERAERIGGHVTVSSRSGAGTEIELSVPGKIAYQVEPSRSRMFLYKITGTTPVHLRKIKKGDGQ